MASSKLGSIKTELVVAFIFAILTTIGYAISALTSFFGLIAMAATPYIGIFFVIPALIWIIIIIALFVLALLMTLRINHMRAAADKNDIKGLQSLNSMLWAIVGIFIGVIPGVMLLIAQGPIRELSESDAEEQEEDMGANIKKLAGLKSLLDSGAITKKEFDAQKAKILGKSSSSSETPSSTEGKLKRLKALLDDGTLTRKEYDAQKKEILESM